MSVTIPAETVEYAPDRFLDIHRPPAGSAGPWPVLLLWHGKAPDSRFELAPLAREAAGHGLLVLTPDWRSDAEDSGRADLLASLEHTHRHAADHGGDPALGLVLAGWSMSGREAIALATHRDLPEDRRPTAAVGIASSYARPAVTTGEAPLAALADRPSPVPLFLVHGTGDDLVPADTTRALDTALLTPAAEFLQLDTDHAGVILTEYDPALGHCVAARAPHAVEAGRATAALLARAAGVPVRA
ncbi:alpha/beta hydrolase [Kitasatospora purpeofusca]|uniref:alpha/beta hydrolase family protein n=1 Tax=Kitasatospora purpeofusca TaxID=67352 RepID=UPI002A59FF3A|nr:alpha/beta hydrolase [Kitasatospora purpeofusca]MDY0813290.1 alpha/beta hydrolase [Kitasatospora purpeofusca]